jgi:hypothetical protein
MTAVRPRPLVLLTRAAGGLILGTLIAGCSAGGRVAGPGATTSPAAPTPAATTVAPSTTPASTSTTLFPPAPQPSPDQAAAGMMSAWAADDRAGAAAVATPSAVEQLFAAPYPGAGLAIPRGCSAAFTPIVCTYGPPGGASATDAIYQLNVSPSPRGWYVSSVTVLP